MRSVKFVFEILEILELSYISIKSGIVNSVMTASSSKAYFVLLSASLREPVASFMKRISA